jgi:hypothetical protein
MIEPMLTSEIEVDGEWQVLTIADALKLRGKLMRCIACHGRVISNREYSDGAASHFSHLQAFAYCSREEGVSSPVHPKPVS